MLTVQRLRAGAVVVTSADVRTSAEVTVVDGRIAAVEDVPASVLTPSERDSVLAPAWVNAHAHLELGALRGRVPAGDSFVDWVGGVLRERSSLDRDALVDGAREAAQALLRGGTATVLDIDSLGLVGASAAPLRVIRLVELIDASPAEPDDRTRDALGRAAAALAAGDGWSPHGTHTAGDALLAELGALLGRAQASGRSLPVRTVHWAESPEEVEWLEHGTGRFAAWLGPSPRCSGLERLARAGMLDGTLLVHGNHPSPRDLECLGRAQGVGVVHCPGSHRFFGRAPFPLDAYRALGVPVLLGTDSWASNGHFDMRREVWAAREALGLSAQEAFAAATEVPARWVPDGAVTGTLTQGSFADIVRYVRGASDALEAITARETEVLGVVIGGRPA